MKGAAFFCHLLEDDLHLDEKKNEKKNYHKAKFFRILKLSYSFIAVTIYRLKFAVLCAPI